jgi:hypothetical protein
MPSHISISLPQTGPRKDISLWAKAGPRKDIFESLSLVSGLRKYIGGRTIARVSSLEMEGYCDLSNKGN